MTLPGLVVRNLARNPLRTALTAATIAVSLSLMVVLASFLAINGETTRDLGGHHRLITIGSRGFAQPIPIALVNQIAAMDGVAAASSMAYYGGKYRGESNPFAQYGITPETIFDIYEEFSAPPEQVEAFRDDRAGCVIGRKLAEERGLAPGDPLPLEGTIYPFSLNLTVRAIYDGPAHRDLRACWFHWDYLEEGLKRDFQGQMAGNAGAVVVKCRTEGDQARVARAIDEANRNSDAPTRTQTEEAFVRLFLEMYGDIRGLIRNVGLAILFALACVAGNTMAMSLRERTGEVAILKAIGFRAPLLVGLILAESMLVAGLGGAIGVFGAKALLDAFDLSRFGGGMVPIFYVPWSIVALGLAIALAIGLVSGIFPALRAARMTVTEGLREVG